MADQLSVDSVLGDRYRLVRELAHGGMGSVYVGEDDLLGREVAVKVLDPRLARDQAIRTRFQREAVAAARLTHPGVVSVYDTGEDAGNAYIVMELVEGHTLREILDERGRMPPEVAADLARQVAEALADAHRNGVVHRDVKPGNILIRRDGGVKVADFGIAKATGASDLTSTGMVIGTARYLAPEQAAGKPTDARTDVYALGLVLYEMLTGSVPFTRDTDMATAAARLTNYPRPVSALAPDVPDWLDAVVRRALAREPERRFRSADELATALARGSTAALPPTPPPRPQARPRPRPPVAAPTPRPAAVRAAVPPPARTSPVAWILVVLAVIVAAVAIMWAVTVAQDRSDSSSFGVGAAEATAVASHETPRG